ncbi:MAG: hypothetical protein ACLTMO_07820 [Faecalibacterium prausnitzii]
MRSWTGWWRDHCRRQKNNPCLVGEPGVGKTALAEGLAQRIASRNVPRMLQGGGCWRWIWPALWRAPSTRGDFEERFRPFWRSLCGTAAPSCLWTSSTPSWEAGAAEGAIDAASILKPVLARGAAAHRGLPPIGSSHPYPEDAALERRFGRVQIEEPTPAQAAAIAEGLAPRYERYHSVHLPPRHCGRPWSSGAVPAGALPADKAIDLVDEACAAARIRAERRKADPPSPGRTLPG